MRMQNWIAKSWIWRRAVLAGLVAIPVAGCAGIIPQAAAQTSQSSAPYVAPPPSEMRETPDRERAQVPQGPSRQLTDSINALGRAFNGEVGIAVRDVEEGWTVSWNGERYLPQQSVSKTWVAMTVLDQVDRGEMSLDRMVRVRPEDAVVFHQPMLSRMGSGGFQAPIRELFVQAMTRSDNLANDRLLWLAGGPEAVRAFFERNDLEGLRFGPGERELQAGIAGLTWRQAMARGRAFYTARSNLAQSLRRAAMDRYLADPIDGATPNGMVEALARLAQGELLSERSTRLMIDTMRASRTGPRRLSGGVPNGWQFGHKTGTGQNLNGMVAGYNDVGILTTPDGRDYAVAVLIGNTRVGIPARQDLMQRVMGQVVSHHLRRRYELFTGGIRTSD
ncbi:class A beta-lactamase [Parasphingopyxis algicola]|uniref:class A beta-lactamase n=1 Tax=Parasphingopyxis algicola TaxID=2026624 RepID=UPI0015A4DDDB|nr:class A beta-lactamase [Parasphingopyxis algicola]QLC26148.1 class A beta-lactamase [Parasphingopyxis algicola]